MSDKQPPDSPEAAAPDLPDWLRDMTTQGERQPVPQRFSAFSVTAILLVVGVLIVIGYALYQRNQDTPTSGPAPKFTVTTFDGQEVKLTGLKGKAVVINFWASYCIPCRVEAPMLERIWRAYRERDVVFLGINTDDIDSDARAYLAEYEITYLNAPDKGGRVEDAYRITGIPETFIINREGEIIRHFLSQPDEGDLRAEIERALEK